MRFIDRYDRFMRAFYWPCLINMSVALVIIPLAMLSPWVTLPVLKSFMWLSVGLTATCFLFSIVDGRLQRTTMAASMMNFEGNINFAKRVEPRLILFRNAGFGLWILIMGFAAISNFSPRMPVFAAYGLTAFGGIVLQTLQNLKYDTGVATEALAYGNEQVSTPAPKTTLMDMLGWFMAMAVILGGTAAVASVFFGLDLI